MATSTAAATIRSIHSCAATASRRPSSDGYKIDLRGAAIEVAERLGIVDDVRAQAAGVPTTAFVDGAGRRVAEIPADLFMDRGAEDVEIIRGEEQFVHDLGHGVAIYSVPNDLGLDREELLYPEAGRTLSAYSTAGSADACAMFLFRTPDGVRGDRRLRRPDLPGTHGRLVARAGHPRR